MIPVINFYGNIKQFEKQCTEAARKHIPFAVGQTLTDLARNVQTAEQVNEVKVLDRPRPFTQGAVRVVPALRDNWHTAKVVMQDLSAWYLEPYEFGGLNKLNSRALLKPIAAIKNLDQYGNLPRNLLAKLKARNDVFVGKVKTKKGYVDGVWQRDATKDIALLKSKGLRVHGIRGYNRTGGLKLLIRFADAHPVKQRLDWFGVADRTVAGQFDRLMQRNLARAVANIKVPR